jgi:hypothetical protein
MFFLYSSFLPVVAVVAVVLLGLLVAVIARSVGGRKDEDAVGDDRPVDTVAAEPPEKPRTGLLGWLDERMNPIVLKELRQAVRSRFIVGVLMLLLGLQLLVLLLFVMYDDDLARQGGMRVFGVLYGLLTGLSLLLIAGYAGVRLSSELSGQNMDLMFITTLRPRSIILGKVLAAAILALMMYSTCMPFMSFTYLLRGIDLPTIFASLGASYIGVLLAICLAIFLGSIRGAVITKLLLAGAFLLSMILHGSLATLVVSMSYGLAGADYWPMMGTLVGLEVLGMGLLAVLAIAMVMPPVANRALPVRLYLTIAWAVSGAVAALWAWSQASKDPMDVWGTVTMLLLCVAIPVSASERDELPPRVRRMIPRRRLLRPGAFLLFSGSGAGMLWCLLLGGATMAVLYVSYAMWGGWGMAPTHVMVARRGLTSSGLAGGFWNEMFAAKLGIAATYLFIATVLSGLVTRFLWSRQGRRHTWIGAFILLGLLAMLPIMIYGSAYPQWGKVKYLSTVYVLISDRVDSGLLVVFAVGLLAAMAWAPIVVRQALRFAPPPRPAPAVAAAQAEAPRRG